jgi:hypothetical protein
MRPMRPCFIVSRWTNGDAKGTMDSVVDLGEAEAGSWRTVGPPDPDGRPPNPGSPWQPFPSYPISIYLPTPGTRAAEWGSGMLNSNDGRHLRVVLVYSIE